MKLISVRIRIKNQLHKQGFSPLYQTTSQEEGEKTQRGYLAQGHTTRMAEPGLRAQVCLASKCVLSTTPHCCLDLVITGYISSYPLGKKFRYTSSYSVSLFFFLLHFLSPFFSLPISIPLLSFFFLLCLHLKYANNTQIGQRGYKRFLSSDLLNSSTAYIIA